MKSLLIFIFVTLSLTASSYVTACDYSNPDVAAMMRRLQSRIDDTDRALIRPAGQPAGAANGSGSSGTQPALPQAPTPQPRITPCQRLSSCLKRLLS